ncbi:phosphoribosylglycinamide formyltransferase [Telmatospirillum siberiense]|uniref:Phosphoribosylglycinamide formyltransferase n=1 Tax=Telmatospirillum siberiense TaxID=382514 RepID=A0A2N3PU75_9PROT|nr:phosphoribosylglycinamide formyltransferase [Telmatospirillum siberiense]PKU23962.1 phosphoribosylglycinamide formyltransferase [Telmatospirillum siberiense]
MAGLKVGVLISGRGSNLQSLLTACAASHFPARVALVISNRADAEGLRHAGDTGVTSLVIDHRNYPDRERFDAALDQALRAAGIELVCLAGFMRLLTPGFVTAWQGRLINIHPSLLPSFKGMHTHRQALAAGVRIHGCTVHFVTADLDAGPIIAQAAVPVGANDDEESLAARVLEAEHRLYPLALSMLASGRARLDGDRVILSDTFPTGQEMLMEPHGLSGV